MPRPGREFGDALIRAQSTLAAGGRQQAARILEQAVDRFGLDPARSNDAGNLFAACERFEQATRCYREAIDSGFNRPQALNNLANVLVYAGEPAGAVPYYRAALEENGGDAETRANLAAALDALGEALEAGALHREALGAAPDHPKFNLNYALHLLRAGRVLEAIPHYRHRFASPAWGEELRALAKLPRPRSGDPFEAGTIVVGEQGLGDEVYLLSRLASLACPADWSYVGDARLEALFKRSFPGARFVSRSARSIEDLLTRSQRVWRLDHVLRYAVEQQAAVEFRPLAVDRGSIGYWRSVLPAAGEKPLVGVSWTGGRRRADRRRRELPPGQWGALAALDCTFVDIQYDDRPDERRLLAGCLGQDPVRPVGFDLRSRFEHSLGLLNVLDHLVLVDNSTAHLAGALGLDAHVMLSHVSDWRWGVGSSRSIVYPSLRLHRQRRPGDWNGALARVATRI